jgi:7,8-dihydroneopterin aldolase/epimerase/oxygenase
VGPPRRSGYLLAATTRRMPATTPAPDGYPAGGTVRLINAVFYARHGVMEEEHRIGGRYEVDAAMDLDFSEAARHDALERTVDYERVYALVRARNGQLVLPHRAAGVPHRARGDRRLPAVHRVEVTVRKVNPPVGGPADRAEATWRAARAKG